MSYGLPQILFFAFCIGISAYAARFFVIGMRSRSWSSVQGTITTSRVEWVSMAGKGGSEYKPILMLSYSYTVNGQPYSGKRIAIAPSTWFSLGTPAKLHAKYPEHAQVAVFYNPARPGESTLLNGVPGYLWSFYLIACMFTLFAALFLVNLL